MQGELRLCRLLANGLDVPCAPGQGGGAERALLGSTRVLPQPQRSLHPPRRDSVTPMLGAHSNSARTGQLAASAIRACVADDSRATGQRERAQEAREGATVTFETFDKEPVLEQGATAISLRLPSPSPPLTSHGPQPQGLRSRRYEGWGQRVLGAATLAQIAAFAAHLRPDFTRSTVYGTKLRMTAKGVNQSAYLTSEALRADRQER